jgi:predicted ATPase
MLGNAAYDPQLLNLLYEETEGNAFFMVEVVRAWAEEAGQLSDVGQVDLPATVLTGGMKQIVQRRLKKVPAWAYGGLQVAAVMGRNLNLDILDRILSPILSLMTGEDISASVSTVWREKRGLTLNDWLLVCADNAILEIYDGDWRFSHDKLREQLLVDLDTEQMRLLRRQVEKATNAIKRSTNN